MSEPTTTNTSPIKSGDNRLSRKFLGNTEKPTNFDQSELKAYVKGYQKFRYGFYTNEIGQRQPAYHIVRQEYFYVNKQGVRV